MPMEQARAMAGAAKEQLAVVQDADRGLEVRLKRARDTLSIAQGRIERVRGAFLKNAPEVGALLRRYDHLQREQYPRRDPGPRRL